MKSIYLSALLMVFSWGLRAQDSTALKGKWDAEWRTFFSATFNEGSLQNYQALTTGGKFKYAQPLTRKLTLAGALYLSLDTQIQQPGTRDRATNRLSRYEIGLLNVQNAADHFIAFPGELYLEYRTGQHRLILGRMKIKSPFLNPQDGRMIPTLEEGIWYENNQSRPFGFKVGLIHRIAPRSSSGFFKVGESIGIYPAGRAPQGGVSAYPGKVDADFLAIGQVNGRLGNRIRFEAWNYYVEGVFNTFYLKPQIDLDSGMKLSLEWVHQNRLGNGGSPLANERYFTSNASDILGLQVQWPVGKGKLSVGYDHILSRGRFLFPREWGRESLFSFQKRERSEGAGGNHALVVYYENLLGPEERLKSIVSLGYQLRHPVTDTRLNKYGMPDYMHFNLDLFWQPAQLPRLKPELLLTYKLKTGNGHLDPVFILNKVSMFHLSLVVNYRLG